MQVPSGLQRCNVPNNDLRSNPAIVLFNLVCHTGGVLWLRALRHKEYSSNRGVSAPRWEVSITIHNHLIVSVFDLIKRHRINISNPHKHRICASHTRSPHNRCFLTISKLQNISEQKASRVANARASGVVSIRMNPYLFGNSYTLRREASDRAQEAREPE